MPRAALVGSRIRERRSLLGLRQADVARAAGISPAYLNLIEHNRRRIADYPRLQAYMTRILQLPGVARTVSLDHIKAGYYSIKALNPTGIVSAGPDHVTALIAAAS